MHDYDLGKRETAEKLEGDNLRELLVELLETLQGFADVLDWSGLRSASATPE